MTSVAGALTQVGARGIANQYLDINPQVSFFVQKFARPAAFAKAEAEIPFQGSVQFGKSNVCELPRNGDCLGQTYLKLGIPAIRNAIARSTDNEYLIWTDCIGFTAIDFVDMEAGSQLVDRLHGHWMARLSMFSRRPGKPLHSLIGPTPQSNQNDFAHAIEFAQSAQTLHVPLPFYHTLSNENFFPTIALSQHVIRFRVVLRPVADLICLLTIDPVAGPSFGTAAEAMVAAKAALLGGTSGSVFEGGQSLSMDLLVNWIYLDLPERQQKSAQKHQYLITQNQDQSGNSVAPKSPSITVPLYFNHPVTSMYWAFRSKDSMLRNRWTDFSVVYPDADHGGSDSLNADGLTTDAIQSFQLKINGTDRIAKRESIYFRSVTASEHHSAIPNCTYGEFVYMYGFALDAESYARPTGSMNFARVDNAQAIFYMRPGFDSEAIAINNSEALGGGEILINVRSWNVVNIKGGLFSMVFV